MSSITDIADEATFHSHVSALPPTTLAAISFHTPWAAPCKQMHLILETLASSYPPQSPPVISFLSLDAEALPEISESYDVTAVPFLVLQRDGKVLESVSGSEASKVRDAVERHAGKGGNTGKLGLPPALEAIPVVHEEGKDQQTEKAKNLSSYAPDNDDAATAPEMSSTQGQKEELNQRLGELVKAAPVMLFMKGTPSTPQCGFSRQLVGLLREKGVRYGFFNILADEEVRQGLKAWSDWPTFPQLYLKGELVGGLDIVKEELDSDPDFFSEYQAAPKGQGDRKFLARWEVDLSLHFVASALPLAVRFAAIIKRPPIPVKVILQLQSAAPGEDELLRVHGWMSGGGEHLKDEGSRLQVVAAGAIAGLVSRSCIAPLDVLKIRLQLQVHSLSDPLSNRGSATIARYGIGNTFKNILRNEGITALWKGNVAASFLYINYGAVQFSVYRAITTIIHPLSLPNEAEAFVSGAVAGASATTSTYPLDLLRTRFAAQGLDKVYASLRGGIRDIWRQEGPKGFFQGLGAGVGQVVPYMGLFFSAYEALRSPLATLSLPFGSGDATAGILAGVLAKTGVFPLDLIRKRLQVQGPTRARYVGGTIPVYGKGVWRTGKSIVAREGWKGLYRGLGVGLVKSAPASAITMWTYERVLKVLKEIEKPIEKM